MPTVLVFTGSLLPTSETFIDQHARSLRRFDSLLVGLKKVAGIATDPAKTRILSLNVVEKLGLYFFGICRPLDKLVEDNEIAILHAHFLDNGILLARYAARKRIPLLVTLHGADVLRNAAGISLRRRLSRQFLQKTLLETVARFLPVSDYLLAECKKRGFPAARMTRHYLGIPLATNEMAEGETRSNKVLFVGRLVEKKGVFFLLDAIERLVQQGKKVNAVFIGTGPLADHLQRSARDRSLPIEFRGAQPHQEVLREMKSSTIFCMPSTQATDGDNEGLGLVYLEAQMLGVPVVAFRQGPVPEAVADQETGLLATDRDVESLTRALAAILDDAELARNMGRKGRAHVHANFDIMRQSKRLEDIYDTVLQEHAGTAGLKNSESLSRQEQRAV